MNDLIAIFIGKNLFDTLVALLVFWIVMPLFIPSQVMELIEKVVTYKLKDK